MYLKQKSFELYKNVELKIISTQYLVIITLQKTKIEFCVCKIALCSCDVTLVTFNSELNVGI